MKLPSEAIPEKLIQDDPILADILSLFDYSYSSIRKKLMTLWDLTDPATIPDSLIDYVLYSKGIPLYFLLNATQKRSLIQYFNQSIVSEPIGNSGVKVYSGVLKHFPVVPSSITITDGTINATDTENWKLKGNGISTGWINYNTGEYKVYFTNNTTGNVTINYQYRLDLNARRYNLIGLEQFIKCLINNVINVDVFTEPKKLMFFEFRLYGFANSAMRLTAGQTYGDQVGYIPNTPILETQLNNTTILIYNSSTVTTDEFSLLKKILKFEIKNTDFTQTNKIQIMKLITNNVNLVQVSSDYKITHSGAANFTTLFASPGEKFIGIKHSSLSRIKTYKISAVQNSTTLLLDPDQTFILENNVIGYSANLTQISNIGF